MVATRDGQAARRLCVDCVADRNQPKAQKPVMDQEPDERQSRELQAFMVMEVCALAFVARFDLDSVHYPSFTFPAWHLQVMEVMCWISAVGDNLPELINSGAVVFIMGCVLCRPAIQLKVGDGLDA